MDYVPQPGDHVGVSFTGVVVSSYGNGTRVRSDTPPVGKTEWINCLNPSTLTLIHRADPVGTIRLGSESGNYAILTRTVGDLPWRIVDPDTGTALRWAHLSWVQDWPVIWTPDA